MKLPKVTKKKFDNWINFYLNLYNRKLKSESQRHFKKPFKFILSFTLLFSASLRFFLISLK